MNDQVKEILEKLQKRADLVATGVLVGLLCLAGYMLLNESNFTPPEQPNPTPKEFTILLPSERMKDKVVPVYRDAIMAVEGKLISTQTDITKDTKAVKLIRPNMFDRKSTTEEGAAREELNKEYRNAESFFKEKRYTDALRVVNGILDRDPSHREALDLQNQIAAITAPTPVPDQPVAPTP